MWVVARSRKGATAGAVTTGCGSAWLEHLTGGQEIVGSNPATPTDQRSVEMRQWFRVFAYTYKVNRDKLPWLARVIYALDDATTVALRKH